MNERDRREFFRTPMRDDAQQATIAWNKQQVSVRVVEESSKGFTAQSLHPLKLSPGQVAELRLSDRVYEVRVLRMAAHDRGSCIGLERLQQVAYIVGGKERRFNDPRKQQRRRFSKRAWLAIAATVLTVALTLPWWSHTTGGKALLAIVLLRQPEPAWRPELPPLQLTAELRKAVRTQTGINIFLLPEVSRLLALSNEQQRKLQDLAATVSGPAPNAQSAENDPTRLRAALGMLTAEQHLRFSEIVDQSTSPLQLVQRMVKRNWQRANTRQLLDRLGGPALALPRAVEDLKLTPEQQEKIKTIVEAALDSSEDLYREARKSDREDRTAQAAMQLEQTRASVIAVLTNGQLQILDSLPR